MRFIKVNEAAKELGVSETFLRRAEGKGKIPQAKRDVNGWRVYSSDDLADLRRILQPTEYESKG